MDDEDGRNDEESGHRRASSSAAVAVHPAAPRLLDSLRERLRYMHCSLRTEEAYVYRVRGFVRWAGGRRHPREMGATEVQALLSILANERRVAAATYRQTLSALLFLYREVLGVDDDGELDRDPGIRVREPFFPCYRATPSCTAAATSAS